MAGLLLPGSLLLLPQLRHTGIIPDTKVPVHTESRGDLWACSHLLISPFHLGVSHFVTGAAWSPA